MILEDIFDCADQKKLGSSVKESDLCSTWNQLNICAGVHKIRFQVD